MKTTFWPMCIFISHITLPVKVWSRVCTGGYQCTAPRECCQQGCCTYSPSSSNYSPKNPVDNYYVINSPIKYYLWLVLLMVVVALSLAWCCRLRRIWRWSCSGCGAREGCGNCGGCGNAPPASEADSAGSCYFPPQYSRCGSLCRVAAQPAPPPYNEVTSKPDLYPMVIYLGPDKSEGDLMVQYYKNYIVKPNGSLSAASTADSLSSSYLCNTANEANTIIPPPYSCAGSLEWSSAPTTAAQRQTLLRSISSVTCHEQVTSPRRSLHHSISTHLRPEPAGIANSVTADNLNDYDNNPIAQTSSGNSQGPIQKPTHAIHHHPPSNSNKQANLNLPSSARVYSNDLNGVNDNNDHSNHEYFNVWEYNAASDALNHNLNKNYPQSVSPRQKVNKYFNRLSSESLEENNPSGYNQYPDYSMTQRSTNTTYEENLVPNANYSVSQYFKNNNEGDHNDNVKKSNISEKNQRDFSFHDSACERSMAHLDSLDENQYCAFFSHSTVGRQNENNSSDYSIYTKNLNNFGSKDEIRRMFSVGNSMTGSEVSSLANLGTPDSPPRATSPTSEFKELLDKIQQLPNDNEEQDNNTNEESYFASDTNKAKRYFCKNRKSSLYMPLNLVPSSKTFHLGKVSPTTNVCFKRQFSRKGWLSRSAPTTPCSNSIVPSILTIAQRNGASNSGRASRLSKTSQPDSSPLLTEKNDSGDEGDEQ